MSSRNPNQLDIWGTESYEQVVRCFTRAVTFLREAEFTTIQQQMRL